MFVARTLVARVPEAPPPLYCQHVCLTDEALEKTTDLRLNRKRGGAGACGQPDKVKEKVVVPSVLLPARNDVIDLDWRLLSSGAVSFATLHPCLFSPTFKNKWLRTIGLPPWAVIKNS